MKKEKPKEEQLKKKILTVKTSLNSVLKNENLRETIDEATINTSKIVSHSFQFIKMFFLREIQKGEELPKVDSSFLRLIFKVFFSKTYKSKGNILKDKLRSFYDEEYSPFCANEMINSHNLKNILDYSSDLMIVNIENNIKMNYLKYVKRYINVIFHKKEFIEEVKLLHTNGDLTKKEKNAKISEKCKSLNLIVSDLLFEKEKKNFKSGLPLEKIKTLRQRILPEKMKINDENIIYTLKSNPQKFLPVMIKMMIEIEEKGAKVYNIFPVSKGFIPGFIGIDTEILIRLTTGRNTISPFKGETQTDLLSKIIKNDKEKIRIWEKCFHLSKNEKIFRVKSKRKGYSFNFLIYTDGVSFNITLKKEMEYEAFQKEKAEDEFLEKERYLSKISSDEREKLLSSTSSNKIVGIDPNRQDLIFCMNSEGKKFRYTLAQRKREIKTRRYREIHAEIKEYYSIGETELRLSKHDHKTLNIDKYKEYLSLRSEVSTKMRDCYTNLSFRKLRLNKYSNTKRSESNLIKNFSQIYGKPSEGVIVAFGD